MKLHVSNPITYENVLEDLCTIINVSSPDLTLDMSAVSLSPHVGEKGVSSGVSMEPGDDARQPSVDGLHSPSSPNAPTAVAKQGNGTLCACACYMLQ